MEHTNAPGRAKAPRDKVLDRRAVFEGQVIFKQGWPGDTIYLVQAGEIRLVKETPAGEVEIARVGGGGIFGEMALFDGFPRMATAKAVGSSVIIGMNRGEMINRLQSVDRVTRSAFELLLRYIRETPPYGERETTGHTKETEFDRDARELLKSDAVRNATQVKDRFLAAMFDVIRTYVERRLPPV